MWLCTQFGFFSIVQKKPGEFHVRARLKKDLENLREHCCRLLLPGEFIERFRKGVAPKWKILRTSPGDYRWRIVVGEPEVSAIMLCLSKSIDYSNFKSRIHGLPDQREKCSAYAGLWSEMVRLQN